MTVEETPTPTPTPWQIPRYEIPPLQNDRQRFEAACDSFESAWKAGRVPSIEEYLNWVEPAQQTHLLQELIELELFYRRQQGETVQRSNYRPRFEALDDGSVVLSPAGGDSPRSEPFTPQVDKPTTGRMPQPGFGYEIQSEIGRGGMGIVYLARQIRLNRLVALKMILAGELASFEERVRFRREAETAARLQHPHIVQVYDVGEHEGQAYLAMEYVRGGTLAQWMNGLPQPPHQAAAMLETLACAVQHAHEQGVVHSDLKPANVLLTGGSEPNNNVEHAVEQQEEIVPKTPVSTRKVDAEPAVPARSTDATSNTPVPRSPDVARRDETGRTLADAPRPKIADFGLAKVLGNDVTMTRTGALIGTPSYMAPEATGGGDAVGPPADIYSLGAILYEALTGRPPFRGAHFADTIEQVRSQDPVTPRSLQPKIPRDLETICLKCLRKNPSQRFTSAQALADDLRRYLNGEPIAARPSGTWESVFCWTKRHPGPAVGVLSLSLTAAIVLMLSLYFNARLALSLSETKTQRELAGQQRDQVIRQRDELAKQQQTIIEERDKADTQRDAANRQRVAAEFATYTAEMLLTERYLQGAQQIAADQILQRYRPLPGQPDRRGFEWFHLWGRCHRELWTLEAGMGILSDGMPSPDGKLLVLCGNDGSIVVWDIAAQRDRYVLKPPVPREHQEIRFAAMMPMASFSPDGRILATCDGDVRLWDVDTGRELNPESQPLQSTARSIAFSDNGQMLGVGGEDGKITVWNIPQRTISRRWKAADGEIARVVFSPDGNLIVSMTVRCSNGGARFWTVPDARQVHEILHRELTTLYDVAFSPDGQWIAIAEGSKQLERINGRVTILDASNFTTRWLMDTPLDGLYRVTFDPSGKTLWSAADTGLLRRWTVESGTELSALSGHVSRVSSLRLLDSGRSLFTTSYDRGVKFWDTRVPEEPRVWKYPHPDSLRQFAVSSDGRRLAIADVSGRIQVWDTDTQQPVGWPASANGQIPLQFTPDRQRILTKKGETLALLEVSSGQTLVTIDGASTTHLSHETFSADGRFLIAIDLTTKSIPVWDCMTGKYLRRIKAPLNLELSAVAVSPNSDRFAVSYLVDRQTMIDVIRWPEPSTKGVVAEEAIEPTETLESLRIATLTVGPAFHLPNVLAFCPDGQNLLVGSHSGFVMHCDLATMKVERLASHDSPVDWLAVDESGRTAFSASQSGIVKLTDPTHRRERFVLQYSTPDFLGMSWAREANTIVTATKSGTFIFYQAPRETPTWIRQPVPQK